MCHCLRALLWHRKGRLSGCLAQGSGNTETGLAGLQEIYFDWFRISARVFAELSVTRNHGWVEVSNGTDGGLPKARWPKCD